MLAAFIAASATLLITTWGRSDPIEFPVACVDRRRVDRCPHGLGPSSGRLPTKARPPHRCRRCPISAECRSRLRDGIAERAPDRAGQRRPCGVGTRLAPEAAARQLAWFCALTVGGLIVANCAPIQAMARHGCGWSDGRAGAGQRSDGTRRARSAGGRREQICAEGVVVVCVERARVLPAGVARRH